MKGLFFSFLVIMISALHSSAALASTSVDMFFTSKEGLGQSVGTIKVENSPFGLIFTPNLHNLSPGLHGFHIHLNPSCADNGMAAGGHFDPKNTGKHLGPYNEGGHLGDLPVLYVGSDGKAQTPVLAPRLSMSDLAHHSLMLHDGGDNYSDQPAKLGGGGARMVCGVID